MSAFAVACKFSATIIVDDPNITTKQAACEKVKQMPVEQLFNKCQRRLRLDVKAMLMRHDSGDILGEDHTPTVGVVFGDLENLK